MIVELADYKKNGICRRLVVTGCLPERYREEILQTMPEVDVFLGTGAFDQIVSGGGRPPRIVHEAILPDPDRVLSRPARSPAGALHRPTWPTSRSPRAAARAAPTASSRSCAAATRAGRLEDVVAEARELVASGVQGADPGGPGHDRLRRRSGPGGIPRTDGQPPGRSFRRQGPEGEKPWIRVLYGHPESIDEEFIRAVAAHPNVCPYFDVPIQHASNHVLKRMGRRYTRDSLRDLFRRIRAQVPGASLRTTVIVGFPGRDRQGLCGGAGVRRGDSV